MPELPEAENIRIGLEKYLKGHSIKNVEVLNRRIFQGDGKKLIDAKFESAERFGKMIAINFNNGFSLLAHVKLTGQFIYRGPNLPNPPELSVKVTDGLGGKHTHVIFHLNRGGVLYYNDIRKFGWIKVVETKKLKNEAVSKLGPEPLKDLTLNLFTKTLSSSKRAVKVILMDQSKISGIGNIYANDALWLSQIAPTRSSQSLSEKEIKTLYRAIKKVLREGLKQGGASELAFVTPDGTEGKYQDHTLVYGREGELCKRCKKAKIKKIFLSGRGTYFCPNCQYD